jgi:predicted DNA binding protein
MFDLLLSAPCVDRATNMHWNYTGEEFGVMHYVEGDIEAFERRIEAVETVTAYELTPAGEDAFYAYVRDATNESLRATFEVIFRDPVVVVPPVEFTESGRVTFSVFGPSGDVQAAVDGLDDSLGVTVTAVTGLEGTPGVVESPLSDRQRDAVETALELGYYEIPREASHEDVAAAVDCAPSTAAEHLRKAEAKLLRSMLEGRG